jgi:hypothetical protein
MQPGDRAPAVVSRSAAAGAKEQKDKAPAADSSNVAKVVRIGVFLGASIDWLNRASGMTA